MAERAPGRTGHEIIIQLHDIFFLQELVDDLQAIKSQAGDAVDSQLEQKVEEVYDFTKRHQSSGLRPVFFAVCMGAARTPGLRALTYAEIEADQTGLTPEDKDSLLEHAHTFWGAKASEEPAVFSDVVRSEIRRARDFLKESNAAGDPVVHSRLYEMALVGLAAGLTAETATQEYSKELYSLSLAHVV